MRRGLSASGPFTAIGTGVTTTNFTETGLANGTTYYYAIAAVNAAGVSADSTVVSATPVAPVTETALESWREANFGTTGNTGDAADAADPDGDGRSNLLEYATGTDPLAADTGALLAVGTSGDGQHLTVTFNRIADETLTYSVEGVSDLATGTWTSVWSSTGAQNTAGPVTVTDTGALSPRRFLRLHVSY